MTTPPTPRTTLVTPAGDIKKGTGSLIAIVFGTLLMVFGMAWGLIAVLITKAHSTADDIVVGSCLVAAFALVLPADFTAAITAIKPVIPWGRRADDK